MFWLERKLYIVRCLQGKQKEKIYYLSLILHPKQPFHNFKASR